MTFILTDDRAKQIIAETCAADASLVSAAIKINLTQFKHDIETCLYLFVSLMELGKGARARARLKALKIIKRNSTKVGALLVYAASDNWLRRQLSLKLAVPNIGPDSPIELLQSIPLGEKALELTISRLKLIAETDAIEPVSVDIKMSAFEGFAGRFLPEIFEKYFGKPAKRKRDFSVSDKIGGAIITFAIAVMRETNIKKSNGTPYTKEAISKAITLERSAKGRRRKR